MRLDAWQEPAGPTRLVVQLSAGPEQSATALSAEKPDARPKALRAVQVARAAHAAAPRVLAPELAWAAAVAVRRGAWVLLPREPEQLAQQESRAWQRRVPLQALAAQPASPLGEAPQAWPVSCAQPSQRLPWPLFPPLQRLRRQLPLPPDPESCAELFPRHPRELSWSAFSSRLHQSPPEGQ